ncbi:hypothetical protein D5081_22265, partial [Pectobacterium carotovorum]|uniref:hypothetical protein n=1 Tax=Pectobacterium carotovorum TaxID=554 RepID=UPI000E75209D
GIAFASKWLISKLNLNLHPVKTTRMTTNSYGLHKSSLSFPAACGDRYYSHIFKGSLHCANYAHSHLENYTSK